MFYFHIVFIIRTIVDQIQKIITFKSKSKIMLSEIAMVDIAFARRNNV